MSWLHPGSTFSTHRCSPCTGLGVCLRHRDHIYRGGYPCSESRRVAATWRRRFSGNGSCRTGGPRRRLRPRRGRRGTMDVSVGPSTATETTAGPAVQGARGTGSRPTLLRLCSAVGTATHAHKPPTTHHPSVPVSHLTMASLPPVLCPPPTPPPPHTHTHQMVFKRDPARAARPATDAPVPQVVISITLRLLGRKRLSPAPTSALAADAVVALDLQGGRALDSSSGALVCACVGVWPRFGSTGWCMMSRGAP